MIYRTLIILIIYRWVERLDAVDTISDLLEPAIHTLEAIKNVRSYKDKI